MFEVRPRIQCPECAERHSLMRETSKAGLSHFKMRFDHVAILVEKIITNSSANATRVDDDQRIAKLGCHSACHYP